MERTYLVMTANRRYCMCGDDGGNRAVFLASVPVGSDLPAGCLWSWNPQGGPLRLAETTVFLREPAGRTELLALTGDDSPNPAECRLVGEVGGIGQILIGGRWRVTTQGVNVAGNRVYVADVTDQVPPPDEEWIVMDLSA